MTGKGRKGFNQAPDDDGSLRLARLKEDTELMRYVLSWGTDDTREYAIPPERMVLTISFTIGSWVDDVWVEGVTTASGIVMGFDESSEVPILILGDYQEFEEALDEDAGKIPTVSEPLREVPLDQVSAIHPTFSPPKGWRPDEG